MRQLHGFVVAALFAAGLAGCGDSLSPLEADYDTDQSTSQEVRFAQYRQQWSAAGIRDYRMTVKLHGAWFSGAADVEVRNGVPVLVSPRKRGDHTVPPEVFRSYDTVEELFVVIENALEKQADRLEVNYHRSVGVPVYADVDVRFSWADDEHGFSVEDFRVLN